MRYVQYSMCGLSVQQSINEKRGFRVERAACDRFTLFILSYILATKVEAIKLNIELILLQPLHIILLQQVGPRVEVINSCDEYQYTRVLANVTAKPAQMCNRLLTVSWHRI